MSEREADPPVGVKTLQQLSLQKAAKEMRNMSQKEAVVLFSKLEDPQKQALFEHFLGDLHATTESLQAVKYEMKIGKSRIPIADWNMRQQRGPYIDAANAVQETISGFHAPHLVPQLRLLLAAWRIAEPWEVHPVFGRPVHYYVDSCHLVLNSKASYRYSLRMRYLEGEAVGNAHGRQHGRQGIEFKLREVISLSLFMARCHRLFSSNRLMLQYSCSLSQRERTWSAPLVFRDNSTVRFESVTAGFGLANVAMVFRGTELARKCLELLLNFLIYVENDECSQEMNTFAFLFKDDIEFLTRAQQDQGYGLTAHHYDNGYWSGSRYPGVVLGPSPLPPPVTGYYGTTTTMV